MKQYRCLPNKSDGIFSVSIPYRFRIVSVSFPYRFRIVSVSFPYHFRIISVSSSYHPPIAKRKTIRNGTKNERMRFGGTRVVNFTITWVSDLGKADWKPCYGCRRIAVFVSHSLETGLLCAEHTFLAKQAYFPQGGNLRPSQYIMTCDILVLWKRLFA